MKKVIGLIIAAILAIGVFAGTVFCVYTFGDFDKDGQDSKKKTENEEVIENVGFIYMYANYAWGKQINGYYVDVDGKKYKFDFSDYDGQMSIDLAITDHDEKSSGKINAGKMAKLAKRARRVGDDLELVGYSYAMDMGAFSVYSVIYDEDGDYEISLLGEYGDWIFVPDDDNARYISEYFGLKFSEAEGLKPSGHKDKDGHYKK